jgi:uncharacterized repeat protein (TIGR03803 family)
MFHNGNTLYGTTYDFQGNEGGGTIFQLSPPATQGDPWTETVIFAFDLNGSYGYAPESGVVFDKAGNLYATTSFGPRESGSVGEIFELSPPAVKGGAWTPKVLYDFGITGPTHPSALTFDKGNALFGTTQSGGGALGGGIVFRVQP